MSTCSKRSRRIGTPARAVGRAALLSVLAALTPACPALAQMPAIDAEPMDMPSMQGGSPPPDARDPHAYAGGRSLDPRRPMLADSHRLGSVQLDRFELARADGHTMVPFDLEAWYGHTYDRAVLRAEGQLDGGDIDHVRTELLWGHGFAAHWDTLLGVRYDSGPGPARRWLAVGVEGLAPYWFEIEATAYLGESGRTAFAVDVSYELLLTQRLILEPRVEAEFYGRRDALLGLGSGLSELLAGLRLRYEIRRELAPYIGVEWLRQHGGTEDATRAAGRDPNDARIVAGLRFWF